VLGEKLAGEVRTEAGHQDAREIADEEGVPVGKLITGRRIQNRTGAVTGTWEFYQSYSTNKVTSGKGHPKTILADKKIIPEDKKIIPEDKKIKKDSSGFFAKRDKKKKDKKKKGSK
jgi:hypothetical protein